MTLGDISETSKKLIGAFKNDNYISKIRPHFFSIRSKPSCDFRQSTWCRSRRVN